MRAVGYVRVSTQEQKMHGFSLDAQRERLQQYADEHDMELIRIYADEGISASKALHRRKGILQLIDDAEKGLFDCILFKDLTRWSRNPSQFYAVQDKLDKLKIPWIAVEQENLETMTASGRLIVGIHISVSAHESAQIGERIRFVNESRVQKKLPLTGELPFGYKVGEIDGQKRVIIDEDKRDLVELAFSTFEQTQCVRQVSQTLKDRGFMLWETSVRRMLKNPLYKGEYHGVKEYCEPYLTEERWNLIQRLISKRNYTPPTETRAYVFSSLVTCAECGRTMVGKTKNGRAYYSCPNHGMNLCSHAHMIREDFLEEYMVSMMDEYLKGVSATVRPKKRKIPNIKGKLARLKDLYIDGDISKDEYLRRKSEYESLIVEPPQKPVIIDGWLDYYRESPTKAKNTAWKTVIDRIIVNDQNEIQVVPF